MSSYYGPATISIIDYVTIMFTELKGSTTLYEAIGDSRAYHLVASIPRCWARPCTRITALL